MPPAVTPSRPRYWPFYWPLTLMGAAMLLARQFQNAALARYPGATRELAVFALATSVFFLLNAATVFVPQMVNVLGRSPRGRRVCFRFTLAAGCLLTLPVAAVAYTPAGPPLVSRLFGVEGETLAGVLRYLRYLAPLIAVEAVQQYVVGLLVQARRTLAVTLLNLLRLALVAGLLLWGLRTGWPAVRTLALSQALPVLVAAALGGALLARLYRPLDEPGREPVTYAAAFRFFWPVAFTSTMFGLSRPVLYGFVGRLDRPEPVLAALRVAMDLAMIFHNPINQFRHLYVTFGMTDRDGLRRFVVRVTAVLSGGLLLLAFTPLGTWIMRRLIGLEPEVLALAVRALRVLCLFPLVIATRNYFHGLCLVRCRTTGMAVGGLLRVAAIYVIGWALSAAGRLGAAGATAALVAGFAVETLVVAAATRMGRGPPLAPHR